MILRAQRRAGATILETVFGFFIIAGAFATVAALYASTMLGQGADRMGALLVYIAESRMEELRALAHEPDGFVGLETQAGTAPAASHSDFTVTTDVELLPRDYPCQGLHEDLTFNGTYKNVTVTVTSPGGETFSLNTLTADPPRPISELRVRRLGAPDTEIPMDEEVIFEAELLDSEDRPIPDISFDFYISLGTGNAQLENLPGGTQARLVNQFVTEAGNSIYTGNSVTVVARAFYAGQEHFGESEPMLLEAPP